MASNGMSEIRTHDDLLIPVCGETVAATRYEPIEDDGPLPALLMYVPYHKDDYITYGAYDPLVRYLAASGYEVVVADMLGTGASSGKISEMFPQREATEAVEIVEWLADRDWTTGRVGMFGKSYGGITALYAAAERPDALEAIVPIETPYTGYRNGYFSGGVFEYYGIGVGWLTLMQVLDVKPPNRRDREGRWADVWRERLEAVRERDPWLFQFLDHEAKDDYWQDKDIDVDRIETPTFAVGGWRDGYTFETMEFFEPIDAPKRLLLGPWRHTMPHRGRESAIDFRPQVVKWFDHFLKDADNGALEHDRIEYWTELDGGGEVDGGVWRGRESWPTAETTDETLPFALTPDGLSRETAFDEALEREYEFDHTVGVHSYDNASPAPGDTNPDDLRSLTFETGPLDSAVEWTGTGTATLRVEPTTDDPIVVVRVMDVAPDGSAIHITHGQVRMQYRDGPEEPNEVVPGQEYELDVPLKPKSHVFEAGHRVRVAISGSWLPRILPTRDQGTFTVRSTPDDPSVVVFPGVERETTSFDDAIEMGSPDETIPSESTFTSGGSSSWEVSRERTTDAATLTTTEAHTIDAPYATVDSETRTEVKALPKDPTSVAANTRSEVTMEYDTETVRIVATNHISRDTTQLTTEVTVDGQRVFEETWTR